MKEISIKKYIRYLFGIAILVFILNKLYIRPWLLRNDVYDPFDIVASIIGLAATFGIIQLFGFTEKKNDA